MKKLLWTSAMALTAAACMTACDDSSSGASNSIPEFKTEAALPDTCEMEVAKVDTAYFACFENKWIEVTDSATVEKIKEGLDEEDLKEELEDMMAKLSSSSKKPSSSSKKVESSDDEEEEEIESSSSEEECTGRRCKTGSSSSKKSSGGNGGSGSGDSGEGGSGEGGDSSPSSTDSSGDSSPSSATSGTSTESMCGTETYDPTEQFCDTRGTGTVYKMVTIGTQTWMAENLNYETASGSYCYNDDPDNCDTYGRLYDWDIAVSTTSPVCPTGWRVPSAADFNSLLSFITDDAGSSATSLLLRSTTGWEVYDGDDQNGSDYYGFNLKPAGNLTSGTYEALGKTSYLVVTDGTYTYFLSTRGRSDAFMYTWTTTTFARSVRCIKDTAGED